MSLRNILPFIVLYSLTLVPSVFGQLAVPARVGPEPTRGNNALRRNSFEPNKPVAMTNKIVKPIPLAATDKENALASIDKHLADAVAGLQSKLKGLLPDELSMLAKTAGWKADHQQALVVALRASDASAVYEAWTQGNPQDTAGAEIAARQTDAKRLITRLAQDVEKNPAGIGQDVTDLDAAVTKITSATPGVADVAPAMSNLKTLAQARKLVDGATPAKGSVVKLPTGKIDLVYDPSLPSGVAIVLCEKAMLIGNQGRGSLKITQGNAAEALGMPIVTGSPVPDLQGEEMTAGTLIMNPAAAKGTINYNVNGNHFVAEPGMGQRLAAGRQWVIEFDRGEKFGTATYTLEQGTYYFTPTDLGWQLYKHRFDIVVDNSQNSQEFNFVFQGEDLTVPANGSRTITSAYPVVVSYDRGNGSEFAKKSMAFIGNVEVGVNASDNLWDLFPTNDNRREVSGLKLFQAR
jgi:hypothetical protein